MQSIRSDPETTAKLSRTGQSLVTLEQAVAVSTQIGAECYVETKALVSSLETHEVFRLAAELANPPPPPAPPLSPSLSRFLLILHLSFGFHFTFSQQNLLTPCSEWAVEPLAGQKALCHTDQGEGCVAAGALQQSKWNKNRNNYKVSDLCKAPTIQYLVVKKGVEGVEVWSVRQFLSMPLLPPPSLSPPHLPDHQIPCLAPFYSHCTLGWKEIFKAGRSCTYCNFELQICIAASSLLLSPLLSVPAPPSFFLPSSSSSFRRRGRGWAEATPLQKSQFKIFYAFW